MVAATPSYGPVTSPYGPRSATGCSDDGQSGKRIQVIYAVSTDRPDRYAQMLPTMQQRLKFVDDTFVWSSLRNGVPNGGSTRQVRWVHDANCAPVIIKALIPPTRNPDGSVAARVESADFGPSMQMVLAWGVANGVDVHRSDRKYIVLVDGAGLDGGNRCGVADSPIDDLTHGPGNVANSGPTYTRIEYICWSSENIDAFNYNVSSTLAHELEHMLGAVNDHAPHANDGHCTDNADVMCYGPLAQTRICPDDQEWLLDCNGDDYFNTAPPAGSFPWSAWNTADSAFLYVPPAPASITQSFGTFVPGLPVQLNATATVPSGQGWKVDYTVTGRTPGNEMCSSTVSSLSGQPTGWQPVCSAATTSMTLQSTLTQEDKRKVVSAPATLTYTGGTRTLSTTFTTATPSVLKGTAATLTATVREQATGTGLYGVPVSFTTPDGPLAATTNAAGVASIMYVPTTGGTLTATTPALPAWTASTASTTLAVTTNTTLAMDTPAAHPASGSTVAFTGTLLTAGANLPVPGVPVALWRSTTGTWSQVGAATTNSSGRVSVATRIDSDATYQLRFAGDNNYSPSVSGQGTVAVVYAASMVVTADAASVMHGDFVRVDIDLRTNAGPLLNVPLSVQRRLLGSPTWTTLVDQPSPLGDGAYYTYLLADGTADYRVVYAGQGLILPVTSSEIRVVALARPDLALTGPSAVATGANATWTATLTADGAPYAGARVTLTDNTAPGDPVIASGTTNAAGQAALTAAVTAVGPMSLTASYAGGPTVAAVTSAALSVTAFKATALTLTMPAQADYNVPFQASASLTAAGSAVPGAAVTLRANGAAVATTTTTTGGLAGFDITPTARTTYTVTYAGTAGYAPATSNAVTQVVTRPVALTLTAPAAATYGAPATFTGRLTWSSTATGIAGKTVSLVATTATGATTIVASAVTDANGNLTFTAPPSAMSVVGGTWSLRYVGESGGAVDLPAADSSAATVPLNRAVTATVTGPATAAAGATSTLTGKVVWAGTTTALAGIPVTLYSSTLATPTAASWTAVGAATTNASGLASFTDKPAVNTTYQVRTTATTVTPGLNASAATSANVALKVTTVQGVGFVPLTPARLLDTRTGTGAAKVRVRANGSVTVQVTGRGGVPASGVSAVAVNTTVVAPSGAGYVTVYPAGAARPVASNLNYPAGATVANMVVAKLGSGGRLTLYSNSATDLVVDVTGYYPSSAKYAPLVPVRLLDTRTGLGAPKARVAAGKTVNVTVLGRGGVPATGVAAVVLNVTAVGASKVGSATVFAAGQTRPDSANLAYRAGGTVPALVIAKVGSSGQVSVYTTAGADLLADVMGYIPTGSDYTAMASTVRVADTRSGLGVTRARVRAGGSLTVAIAGAGGVPLDGVRTAFLTLTAVNPGRAGYLSLYPAGESRPTASVVNFAAGETRANSILARLGTSGKVTVYSPVETDIVVSVAGYAMTPPVP